MKRHGGIITQVESVFTIECFFPAYKDGRGQHTPGRWVTCYSWVYACGKFGDHTMRLTTSQARLLARLKRKSQGYTGRPGALNLHHEGLAYLTLKDCREAVALIRARKSCKYEVRPMRNTVWKEELVVPERAKASELPRPFNIMGVPDGRKKRIPPAKV